MKRIKKKITQALFWLMLGLVPQLAWAEVPMKKAGDVDKLNGSCSSIEKLERRITKLEAEIQRLQKVTSLTSYVKTLMKAKHGNGDQDIFVTGPAEKSCSEICDSVMKPTCNLGATATERNTPIKGSCVAMWCEGQVASRNMPPHDDPFFEYGCDVIQPTYGPKPCKPMCMCNTGWCGWRDDQFSLPEGIKFW
ncbi:hypothetical protein [Candidatus Parabeggiatoa sp. HSG14]|uniref:hypothetical protein n=1 Tax=Candidatus Parabeggiatoa sp. HSG14 TaxID=3055593 RepID=UPI0025A6CB2F|nr:hypothetical protein [Thiotrichales bacterium HSG14]